MCDVVAYIVQIRVCYKKLLHAGHLEVPSPVAQWTLHSLRFYWSTLRTVHIQLCGVSYLSLPTGGPYSYEFHAGRFFLNLTLALTVCKSSAYGPQYHHLTTNYNPQCDQSIIVFTYLCYLLCVICVHTHVHVHVGGGYVPSVGPLTISVGTYSVIGAASFLSGVMRMTISLTIIMIESMWQISYGIPILIAVAVRFVSLYMCIGVQFLISGSLCIT